MINITIKSCENNTIKRNYFLEGEKDENKVSSIKYNTINKVFCELS